MKNQHKNDKRREEISISAKKKSQKAKKKKPLRNTVHIKDIYFYSNISIINIILYNSII